MVLTGEDANLWEFLFLLDESQFQNNFSANKIYGSDNKICDNEVSIVSRDLYRNSFSSGRLRPPPPTENEDGKAVMIYSESYVSILRAFLSTTIHHEG